MLSKKESRIANRNSWIIAFVILLFFYFIYFEFNLIYPVICIVLTITAIIASSPLLNEVKLRKLRMTFFYIIIIWLWCIIVAVIQGADKPLRMRELEYIILGGLLSFLFCNTKISVLPLYLVYYLLVLFFYYQYFIDGVEGYGTDAYGVMGMLSGAQNTIVLLSIGVIIQVVDYRENKKISLLPSIIILPIAIMSWNRTGLFTTILFVLTTFFVGSSFVKKKSRRLFLYVLLTIFLSVIVVANIDWFQSTSIYSKLETQGTETTRRQIWNEYFSDFGVLQFFFGKPIDDSHLLLGIFANAHNSFIMLHSLVGVFAIPFIIVVINRLIYFWKRNKFVFWLFMVLVVRCSFDMMYFFQPFDFVFYFFVFGAKGLFEKQEINNITIV